MTKKLPKIECEICGCKDKKILHKHHIIERTELNTNNDIFNLIVLCPNCHSKHHSGLIKILGMLPSTKLPYKRTAIYEINGKRNIDIDISYIISPKPKQMEIPREEKENDSSR